MQQLVVLRSFAKSTPGWSREVMGVAMLTALPCVRPVTMAAVIRACCGVRKWPIPRKHAHETVQDLARPGRSTRTSESWSSGSRSLPA